MSATGPFSPDVLRLDCARETERIAAALRRELRESLRRQGLIVAMSGGVDSSVVAALCARAVGPQRVLGLLMPERDSSVDTLGLSRLAAERAGVPTLLEEITPLLEAAGCYRRQGEAVRRVIPEFGADWKCKLVRPPVGDRAAYRLFSVVAQSPAGQQRTARLSAAAYLELVAATNFKQRVRKMLEYYHADRLNHAVAGTPNRLEYDLGFFVKLGDGAADLKPIAHLYKSQVYQMAEFLGVPEEIRARPPTTDTYSLPQTQDEFYFSLSFEKLDLCLYGRNHGVPPDAVADAVGFAPERVAQVYREIEVMRNATRYLHLPPLLVAPTQGK